MKVAFYTLGCKVNHYESQAMLELFLAAGWEHVPFSARADVYVINTCTVTGVGDQKSRQMLSRAHRIAPEAPIIAVGCYAQLKPEEVAAVEGVTMVLGTDGRANIVSYAEQCLAGHDKKHLLVGDIDKATRFEELSAVADGRTRAVLKIQDGCRNFCSYCAIPYARGPLRSRQRDSILREWDRLAAEGYREVVLTGIHLASWGKDSGEGDLNDVLRALSGRGVERIRLGSLEPRFCDERFAETVVRCPELCPQFHLSLQSGSATVLKRMHRRYTPEEYARAVSLLREAAPDCAVTTDIIAGFVGETEEEHGESLAFAESIAFARMHVFPYSRRSGTLADKMEGHLPKSVREARAAELIALADRMEQAFVAGMTGKHASVLIESDGTGYTENYVRTAVSGPCREGDVIPVTVTGADGTLALAEPRA